MFNIGPSELILVLVVALFIYGPSKIPELGKTIGSGLREFKRASQEISNQFNITLEEPNRKEPNQENLDRNNIN